VTLTFDLEQGEPACHISRSKVISFENYHQLETQLTCCSAWTTKMIDKNHCWITSRMTIKELQMQSYCNIDLLADLTDVISVIVRLS